MGSCMSKDTTVEEVNPAPHPEARRVWLIATIVDPNDIPADLVGIEADGLKAAMRNRGLETDHWALRVDPPSNVKAEYSIFDFTVENGRLISQTHSAISPYWKIVNRRVAVGWTIWKDDEIFEASKLLIQARPKYEGRSNNSQILARLLGRHIEFAPQAPQAVMTTTSETVTAIGVSPAGSILNKPASLNQEGASILAVNRSQMTLVSATQSQQSESSESEIQEMATASSTTVSRMPASIRQSQRMSVARPPLIHLSSAPSAAGSEMGIQTRPTLQRSAETEHLTSPTGSVRISLPPQPRQQSLLNPSPRFYRQSASEINVEGRARTRSDAASQYHTIGAADRRMTLDGTSRIARPSRRRSEAPADWIPEMPASEVRFSSTRSRKSTHRDSIMSSGNGSMIGSPSGSMLASPPMPHWNVHYGMPPSPTTMAMPGLPMNGFGPPPMPPMPMWPQGSIGPSASMAFSPPGLQVPMPYFAQPSMGMPFHPSMPMLAPPSPGFYSHTSSAVPTPPESPHLSTTHLPKSVVPDMSHAFAGQQIRA